MLKKIWFIFALCPLFLLGQKTNENQLNIEFIHKVDSQILTLDTAKYFNALGQPFFITKFKYYISQIELINEKGKKTESHEVFLINEEEPASKKISISKVKDGEYSQIQFILGVDSLRNCSGAQSGALDPIHAMFWTWNSGYIFLKLEGKSTESSATGNIFEYHIGGYKEPSNCIQTIHFNLKSPLIFSKKSSQNLTIQVNVAELLKHPVVIDFKTMPSVTDTKNAKLISTNYSDMFSIQ